MKTSWRPLLWVAVATLLAACAQPPAPPRPLLPVAVDALPADTDIPAERARVASARAEVEQRFAQQELQCWQRFAVNDCLRDARQQRRRDLAELRRKDLQLNALQRQRDSAARQQGRQE